MMNLQPILRAFDSKTYDAIQSYRVKDDALLPRAYQNIPGGRPLHDDWTLLRSVRRIDTAYRVPLPFRLEKGSCIQKWMLWDLSYPQSPGLQIKDMEIWDGVKTQILPHALVDCAVENSGYATFSVWLGDKWHPCFQSYRKSIFGRNYAQYTGGLKQDVTVSFDENYNIKSDIMGWWDPPSVSYTKP